jgi:peptidoglycan/xylan/chitin deacetylase (PgdA/CDA1 family)
MNPRERRRLGLVTAGALAGAAVAEFARGNGARAHGFGAAAAGVFLVPTLRRNGGWWGPVMTTFPTREREVWLTIDDGPDREETPRILEVLREFRARATFFCIGRRVALRPGLARAVIEAGHDVQNHTYSHPALTFWAAWPSRVQTEIRRGSQAIHEATGKQPCLFRAPAGLANAFVHTTVANEKLKLVGWSAAGRDGVRHDPDRALCRILGRVRPGSIILLHENRLTGMAPGQRAATLRRLLAELENRRLRTVIPDGPGNSGFTWETKTVV